MIARKKSDQLIARARKRIPGGVNSPVRAWNAVGGAPLVIVRGEGAFLVDADGNRLLDFVCSYGPAILGHAHPVVSAALAEQAKAGLGFGAPTELEIELAEAISDAIKMAEKVRLVSSGTEAGMTAIRIARAATNRQRIIKFDGCYHGHSDALLVRAGSGSMTLGVPDSAGVPGELAQLTLVADYNSIESVAGYFGRYPQEIAAIVVEPIAANMGVVLPQKNFLPRLAELARENGALLICDEVITGFRLGFGSASEMLGVTPDLLMLGKIIGGGLPVGAVAGPAKYLDLLAPAGPVYQAGTLSGNPLSVRGGIETLALLRRSGVYQQLEMLGARLEAGLREAIAKEGEPGCVNRAGSLVTLFLGPTSVHDAKDAARSNKAKFAKFFNAMIERGINLPPSQFEAMFISLSHTDADIDRTVSAAREALAELHSP